MNFGLIDRNSWCSALMDSCCLWARRMFLSIITYSERNNDNENPLEISKMLKKLDSEKTLEIFMAFRVCNLPIRACCLYLVQLQFFEHSFDSYVFTVTYASSFITS